MNYLKSMLLLILTFCINTEILSQDEPINFGNTLNSYYLDKDENLLNNSIDFFNHIDPKNQNIPHLIIGFYGGIFLTSPNIKNEFDENIESFNSIEIKSVFITLLSGNIEKIMNDYPLSPSYNDMNWAAFFSTGNTKYLEKILANCKEADNREDLNLFLTGASAKWSLCSNASQHKLVHDYLSNNTKYKKVSSEIMNSEASDLKNEITNVIIAEREKGNWK